ncbi:hypothetical protein [Streptomyces sp. NPDC056010]|uniref:hypothetical protein n=1 Tax=Streptomyces sp. NPDC056010 TaxID=3345679 RepID=UPI0035E16FDA
MEIIIKGADEAFAEKLVALAAQHDANLSVVTADTRWTTDRAERYLRSLPAGARRFIEMVVVDGDGYLDAERLRQALGKLNGPTVALSRAVPRGVREGWWPEGTSAPISPVWDPDNPSWHKNIAYQMAKENVLHFRSAFARLTSAKAAGGSARPPLGASDRADASSAPDPAAVGKGWGDEDAPAALAFHPSWSSGYDTVPRVDFNSVNEEHK